MSQSTSPSAPLASDQPSFNPDHPDNANLTIKTYPCPHCATPTAWQDNPNKPFCSARCKLIDLGAWANEAYKVAADDAVFSSDLK